MRSICSALVPMVILVGGCHKDSGSGAGASPSSSASGAAVTPTTSSSGGKPPSTGKEFTQPSIKRPTADEARAMLQNALGQAARKDCNNATNGAAQTGLAFAQPDPTYVKSNMDGFVALARCAEKVHAYRFMGYTAHVISTADPKAHPELMARAALGLGDFKGALSVLTAAAKANPKDPEVGVTAAKALCKAEQWDSCGKIADDTLKLVGAPTDPEKKEIAWRAHKYKARSLLHTGKFEQASAEADAAEKLGAPAEELDLVKKAASSGKTHKVLAIPEYGDHIPLGGYHLFGKVPDLGEVAEMKLFNADAKDHEIKVEAEIAGVTEHVTQTVTVLKGKPELVKLNPPLKGGWDVNSIRADSPAQLSIKVTRDGTDAVLEQSYPVTLMPRDSLPLGRFLDRDRTVFIRTPALVAAWVTPNDKAIDEFLTAAKKRLQGGMSGGQSATLPQVKAIYDELQSRGMSYVMDPGLFVEGEAAQRTRLPREVLASTNAQCIEGAILYATLMEAIGLKPVVTLVPGHSFSGWHVEGHDAAPTPPQKVDRLAGLFLLETTTTHDWPFEKSLDYGMKEAFVDHGKEWTMAMPGGTVSDYVDIARARQVGITPQPWQ